jgi:hypothetical protein
MRTRFVAAALGIALAAAVIGAVPGSHATRARAFGYRDLNVVQKRLLSGLASFELTGGSLTAIPAEVSAAINGDGGGGDEGGGEGDGPPSTGGVSANPGGGGGGATNYAPKGKDACDVRFGSNQKVNQNCLNLADPNLQGRSQAQNETAVAQDPNNPSNLVATFNDYRRGDGNCYGAYSTDRGKSWQDTTIPMGFTRGTAFAGGSARQYWEAGGDTSVAWDTRGNAYFSCQVFNRGDAVSPNPDESSAFYVYRSTGNAGASWNFPGRPVREHDDTAGTGDALLDKQYLAVDNNMSSPFRDRVYVTWTEFASDGTGYIYESFSNDYGEHFSPPVLVSGDSDLCTNDYGFATPNGRCNENQFSNPFVGQDGALYVTYNNYNGEATKGNTPDNRNQIFLAKSTDGGATFGPPVKVSDFYDLPDCAAYQGGADFGRACVPEKGATTHSIFRATNYPVGQVNPLNPSQVVVTFGSYINQHSKESNGCVPAGFDPDTGQNLFTGVKTPGACNNDILYSVSNNGGGTFTGTTTDPRALPTVNTDPGQATTSQFWQWSTFNNKGRLAVSYYDRQYGDDETTGNLDFSLTGTKDLSKFKTVRVTSSSMPVPTQFGGVFFGDYTGLSAFDNDAHPIWGDTRPVDLFLCPGTGTPTTPPAVCTATEGPGPQEGVPANDQDAFTDSVNVPG